MIMSAKRKISELIHASNRLKLTFFLHSRIDSIRIRKIFDVILLPMGIMKLISLSIKPIKSEKFKYDLSIVCIVKNEVPYIREWIRYHLSIGVEHFYIYDNDSTDNLTEVLQEFKDKITYTKTSGRLRQLDAYNNALNRFSKETRYLGVIDADEFLYCPENGHEVFPIIDEYLKQSKIGGLVVNWIIYGSSHFDSKPNGLVTNNFLYRSQFEFEKNRLVKTICNPRKVFSFTLTHAANYLPGFYAVNEEYQHIEWVTTKHTSVSKIRINHYYSKSREEFAAKRARGGGDVLTKRRKSEFEEHDKNDVFDDSLKVYNKVHKLN